MKVTEIYSLMKGFDALGYSGQKARHFYSLRYSVVKQVMESNWSIETSVSIHSGRFWPLRRVLACEKSLFASLLAAGDVSFRLADFGKVLCSSANKLQQNSNASSRGEYISQILTVPLQIHCVYIWPLKPFVFFLSFVNIWYIGLKFSEITEIVMFFQYSEISFY